MSLGIDFLCSETGWLIEELWNSHKTTRITIRYLEVSVTYFLTLGKACHLLDITFFLCKRNSLIKRSQEVFKIKMSKSMIACMSINFIFITIVLLVEAQHLKYDWAIPKDVLWLFSFTAIVTWHLLNIPINGSLIYLCIHSQQISDTRGQGKNMALCVRKPRDQM